MQIAVPVIQTILIIGTIGLLAVSLCYLLIIIMRIVLKKTSLRKVRIMKFALLKTYTYQIVGDASYSQIQSFLVLSAMAFMLIFIAGLVGFTILTKFFNL